MSFLHSDPNYFIQFEMKHPVVALKKCNTTHKSYPQVGGHISIMNQDLWHNLTQAQQDDDEQAQDVAARQENRLDLYVRMTRLVLTRSVNNNVKHVKPFHQQLLMIHQKKYLTSVEI